jgi:hypothetical protein
VVEFLPSKHEAEFKTHTTKKEKIEDEIFNILKYSGL